MKLKPFISYEDRGNLHYVYIPLSLIDQTTLTPMALADEIDKTIEMVVIQVKHVSVYTNTFSETEEVRYAKFVIDAPCGVEVLFSTIQSILSNNLK